MVFSSAEDAAVAACIALLLEVSGNPKAGNVDREHDFDDLKYEHFLASAAAAMPAFLNAAKGGGVGECIYQAVESSSRWHRAENVHFGAFLLLVPLLTAWNARNMHDAASRATDVVKKTSSDDSIYVLKAFRLCRARVVRAEKLALEDEATADMLKSRNVNLYEWMSAAPKENLIARELISGYPISLEGANFLLQSELETNERVVWLYHSLLAKYPDPLIIAKSDAFTAKRVMELARKALESGKFDELDRWLLSQRLNPGTIADLVASSIYLALLEGWRF